MLFWQFSGPRATSQAFTRQFTDVKEKRKQKLTSSAVVVDKERVQAGGVDEDVFGADDSQAPSLSAAARAGTGGGKDGVVESRVNGEWCWSIGIWLVVSGQVISSVYMRAIGVRTVSLSG
jgi:hypothetical protein